MLIYYLLQFTRGKGNVWCVVLRLSEKFMTLYTYQRDRIYRTITRNNQIHLTPCYVDSRINAIFIYNGSGSALAITRLHFLAWQTSSTCCGCSPSQNVMGFMLLHI